MKTKFMGVAAALTAALALVFGVAIPGALPSLPAPVAQAQTTEIPVSPQKRDFKDLDTRKYNPPFEFTVEEDATITSLDFQIGGSGWLKAYELKVGNTTLSPKISQSGSAQQAPLTVTHDGLNIAVKKGEIIRISPYFTAPKVSGTVSVSPKGTLSGSTPPPTEPNPEPQPDPEPTPEPNPGASVTPAAPTAVDPATAPSCVEKGYINIPDTKGVDYFIGGERKQAGQHFYEGKKATVKVTAKPQNGYQFAAGAKTEWSFDFSGEVKDCSDSSEDPKPPAVEGRHFDAIGHEFAAVSYTHLTLPTN